MTKDEFVEMLQSHYKEWEWFFNDYRYRNEFVVLEEAIKDRKFREIERIMGKVWFELPDNVFNIIVMPAGWNSFLNCFEGFSECDEPLFDEVSEEQV